MQLLEAGGHAALLRQRGRAFLLTLVIFRAGTRHFREAANCPLSYIAEIT